jgi:hypothetical protein
VRHGAILYRRPATAPTPKTAVASSVPSSLSTTTLAATKHPQLVHGACRAMRVGRTPREPPVVRHRRHDLTTLSSLRRVVNGYDRKNFPAVSTRTTRERYRVCW